MPGLTQDCSNWKASLQKRWKKFMSETTWTELLNPGRGVGYSLGPTSGCLEKKKSQAETCWSSASPCHMFWDDPEGWRAWLEFRITRRIVVGKKGKWIGGCICMYIYTDIYYPSYTTYNIVLCIYSFQLLVLFSVHMIIQVDPPEKKIWQGALIYTKFVHVACNYTWQIFSFGHVLQLQAGKQRLVCPSCWEPCGQHGCGGDFSWLVAYCLKSPPSSLPLGFTM